MDNTNTFGTYVQKKRLELNLTERELARRADLGETYVKHIEYDDSLFPDIYALIRIGQVLKLDKAGEDKFFELAKKSYIPRKIEEFILSNQHVLDTLKFMSEANVTRQECAEFIDKLIKNRNKTQGVSR